MAEEEKKEEKSEATIKDITKRLKKRTASEFTELVEFLKSPRKLFFHNFFAGVIRGLGMAIGFTILGAIVVAITLLLLKKMVTIPLIGKFIVNILDTIKDQVPKGKIY
ncbi:MAG: hypothetical protein COS11_05630 [bacterium (Candidatus Ratteibacteria) CG01_land_8_20_14_3_00_40_19]|uniref:Uncharacterized protein n=1 Tax=bacterium (Candidatus Ratteibacteria) CG01_land_8_20_14_3_00_40_19 TaxID=2014290 RepID=A0A2M7E7R7_9BACT|nr:MAG: hypothetical protein COS11_05630 [bacterium (Candidatus Ratteibacteria) CG01_land_8_20_14_3_00_40_19]